MDNLEFQLLPFRRLRASRIPAVWALHVDLDNMDFHVDKAITVASAGSSGTEAAVEVTFEPSHLGHHLTLAYRPFTAAYSNASLVPLLTLSIDCFCHVKAQSCKESQVFDRGQVASGVTFRTYGHTEGRTDQCKLSIMMIY